MQTFKVKIELGGFSDVIEVPALPRRGDKMIAHFPPGDFPRWHLVVTDIYFHATQNPVGIVVLVDKDQSTDLAKRTNAMVDELHDAAVLNS